MQLLQTLLSAIHGGQAVLASYALYYSVISIQNLRQYEPKMKKAANYSSQAGEQLWMTRKTQGAAAIAIAVSLLSSLTLIVLTSYPSYEPEWPLVFLNAVNIVINLRTLSYVAGFWKHRAKIPFMEGYNEALGKTERIMQLLSALAVCFGVTAVWNLGGVLGIWEEVGQWLYWAWNFG